MAVYWDITMHIRDWHRYLVFIDQEKLAIKMLSTCSMNIKILSFRNCDEIIELPNVEFFIAIWLYTLGKIKLGN